MTALSRVPHSYRNDPDVPDFDDSRPLFVFDGTCVMCSTGARWLMRLDRAGRIALTPAQGVLGQALYRHYGAALDDTYLFLRDGRAFGLSEGYFQVAQVLGGAWRMAFLARAIPRLIRDRLYGVVARNRYRWFGQSAVCALLTPEQRARLIG